jgi:hypothetical protein
MQEPNAGDTTQPPAIPQADIAFFIRTLWEGLINANWPRALLIDFGTAIHDKIALAKMDSARLGKLLPHLSIVAEHLGHLTTFRFSGEFEAFLNSLETKQHSPLQTTTNLSKEDLAYYIRTIWTALLKPDWNRNDLIDLGMAVFTRTTLAKMDQTKLGKLLPNLSIFAEAFGQQVTAKFSALFETTLKNLEPPCAVAASNPEHSPPAIMEPPVAPPVAAPPVAAPPVAAPPVAAPPVIETPVAASPVVEPETPVAPPPLESPPTDPSPPINPASTEAPTEPSAAPEGEPHV